MRTQKKVSAGGWKTVSCLLTGVVSDAPPSFQARRRCRCKCFFTGVDAEDIYQCQGIDADMNGHTGVCVFMSGSERRSGEMRKRRERWRGVVL